MVKLTAEQKAELIKQYKSGDKQGAINSLQKITGKTEITAPREAVKTTVPEVTQAKVGTGSVAQIQTQQTPQLTSQPKTQTNVSNMSTKETGPANLGQTKSQTQYATDIASYWNNLSYDEQQAKLQSNSALKSYIQKNGLVEKKPQSTKETGPLQPTKTSTKQDNWDYQDNSQARMDEIARNLDGYRVTNPELFDNYSNFYNFFINGKNRSQDQIDYLWNYYNKVQQTNKYNNMTSAEVGSGIANGTIPESYMNDIQNTDPQRVAEIKDEKKKAEDQIKNNAYLETLVNQSYDEGESDFWKWNVKEMKYVDENNDGIDDREYHPATEEERAKVERNFEIEAELLDIDNTIKHTYEDLVKAYPGASKATLMAMAQDTNNTLIRKKEDLLVEQTKLQGTIGYLQAERQEMDKAGQQTIADIQKNYGIYASYSPEGVTALAQAKYAATNITLEQAENGTDTQKQMALDSVVSGYMDKYGDIIQRPKQEIINEAMSYAKKNGVSLTTALNETFIKPLRAKPEFEQLNKLTSTPDVVRIGTDANGNPIYGTYNSSTGKFDMIDLSGYGISTTGYTAGSGNNATTPGGVSYTAVSEEAKINGLSDFLNGLNVGDYGGECGAFVNDYLQKIGTGRIYDNNLSTKINSATSDIPEIGSVAVFDYSNAPASSKISDKARKYGHVAIVAGINKDAGTITVVESNKDGDGLVGVREIPMSNMYLKGYFNPSQGYTSQPTDSFGGRFANDSDWNDNGYFNALVPMFKTLVKEGKIDLTDAKYKDVLADYGMNSKEFYEMAANYANTDLKAGGGQQAANALEIAVKLYDYLYGSKSGDIKTNWFLRNTAGYIIPGSDQEKAKGEYDSLMKRLSLNELFAAKDLGATFGAMSDSEWNLLENAATDLKRGRTNFGENLEYLIESLYDAVVDGKATMPRNFVGSSAEQMVKKNKAEGKGIGGTLTNDIYSDLY